MKASTWSGPPRAPAPARPARLASAAALLKQTPRAAPPRTPPFTDPAQILKLEKDALALQERVGLLEMTNHEFLDKNFRVERTTFSDGTTVTVDWDKMSYDVNPPLPAQ